MPQVDQLLQTLKEKEGSDLHLVAGLEPRIRTHGELESVEGWPLLNDDDLRHLMREIASEHQWDCFEKDNDLDFAYGLEGTARFRANFFVQEHGAGAVFRIIPEKIQPLEELNLPEAVGKLAGVRRGLVLVTGPTGSGKSTTLAAVIDKINRSYARHIITIEDPIEFVHQNKQSVLSHREVGAHTKAFAAALRAAIREDADVILWGCSSSARSTRTAPPRPSTASSMRIPPTSRRRHGSRSRTRSLPSWRSSWSPPPTGRGGVP
jgi:twitching motility protein PilT